MTLEKVTAHNLASQEKNAHTSACKPRVRFAPSPTGKLHVGGARTAIFNWAFARAHDGVFILRIDDTDPERSTKENERIILDAMRWMQLDWDEGPDVGGAYGPYKQMERMDIYKEAVEKLLREGKAYPCFCTPEELEAARAEAKARKDPFQGYQRTCRDMNPKLAQARIEAGEPYVVRIKMPLDRGDVYIDDAVHGRVRFEARELDDFVILRSDGTPTYNFTTVVDDALMGITHVIRGDDHLSNTPRQIMVYEALGYPIPTFAHISMILGADGKKLSKRHGATSVEEYRDEGFESEAFLNYLALLGWSKDGETTIITPDEIAKCFSLDHVSKNPATFDPKKLDWINKQYLVNMSDIEFANRIIKPQFERAHFMVETLAEKDNEWFALLAEILKPRVRVAPDVIALSHFLVGGNEPEIEEKALAKALCSTEAKNALVEATQVLTQTDSWDAISINEALHPLPERLGLSNKVFFGALRAAATGSLVSPPLAECMELLGQDCVVARISWALKQIQTN